MEKVMVKEFTTQSQALHFASRVLFKKHRIKYVSANNGELTFHTDKFYCDIVKSSYCYRLIITKKDSKFWYDYRDIPGAYQLIRQLVNHGINIFDIGTYKPNSIYINIGENTYEF